MVWEGVKYVREAFQKMAFKDQVEFHQAEKRGEYSKKREQMTKVQRNKAICHMWGIPNSEISLSLESLWGTEGD